MKPKHHTVQWIAPHLSEGEVRKIYELVVDNIIKPNRYTACDDLGEPAYEGQKRLLLVQMETAATLFGIDNK